MSTHGIRSYHGGLGDELQFTLLPELAFAETGTRTALYDGPDVRPPRNSEILDFVWGANPFITGKTRNWTLGDRPGIKYENLTGTFLKNWSAIHGFKAEAAPRAMPPAATIVPDRIHQWGTCPEWLPNVYRIPTPLWNPPRHLIELSAQTLKYNNFATINSVFDIIDSLELPASLFRQLFTRHAAGQIDMGLKDSIADVSLLGAYTLLGNAEVLITLNSGIHSLAAAAKRYNPRLRVYCLLPPADATWIRQDCKFLYPGIQYL